MNALSSFFPAISRKTRLLTVLDVGSTKICCIIARLRPLDGAKVLSGRSHKLEVLGFGVQRSRGVKAGVIVDLIAAEQAIRLAVDAAERMAGLVVDSVIVNVSCRSMASHHVRAQVPLDGAVDMRDLRRVLAAGSAEAFALERPVLHSVPVSFSIDGEKDIADPRDMVGEALGVKMHIVTAGSAPLRNLEHCINRAHLSVETMVATPFASALSVLVGDEAMLGATCVDLGGGTTTISVLDKGKFVFADTIAIGSDHITMDIARGFSITMEEAERLKVMYGSALTVAADDKHSYTLPPENRLTDTPERFPRAVLSRIIRARVEELLEMTRDRLARSRFGRLVNGRLVLTGGGVQLTGLPDVARSVLNRRLRIGRPLGVSGLPEMARGAAFSSVVGLLIYPQSAGFEEQQMRAVPVQQATGTGRHFQKVGRWLRESF